MVCVQECFDTTYYLKNNPDLVQIPTEEDLWRQFVFHGQFEPRRFRFTCPLDYKSFAGALTV